jgi:hypothetical protein
MQQKPVENQHKKLVLSNGVMEMYCFLKIVVGRKILLHTMSDANLQNVQYNPA